MNECILKEERDAVNNNFCVHWKNDGKEKDIKLEVEGITFSIYRFM